MEIKEKEPPEQVSTFRLDHLIEQVIDKIPQVGNWGVDLSHAIHGKILEKEEVRKIADILHGTWLGHPLHPIFTDITIGAWVIGAILDVTAEAEDSDRYKWAGARLQEIGTIAALPTALSGLTDFSTIPKPASKTATLHGLLNVAGVGLNIVSIIKRRGGKGGKGLSLAALGLMTVSAMMGGMLVYKHKVGTDHSQQVDGLDEWTAVLDAEELPEHSTKQVNIQGKGLLLHHSDNQIFAVGSVCSHAGGPLENGEIGDECVTCPWHDSVFNLRDGSIIHGPATQPQPNYEARVHKGKVEVRLPKNGTNA
jgi:nitrite reductase/ring-hydroxylating ferredoxin subunit/uncharacterized membrane protein